MSKQEYETFERLYNLNHFVGKTYTLSEGLEHRGVADTIKENPKIIEEVT